MTCTDGDYIPVPKKDLEIIKAKTEQRVLRVTEMSIAGLEKLLQRIDGIDDAIARQCDLNKMTPAELYAYFNQAQQSFRLRQDFVRTVAGYDMDISRVPTEADDRTKSQALPESEAERVRNEIMARTNPNNAQMVEAQEVP